MFEKASRLKLRFGTVKGYVSVEDLWDLPLTGTTAVPNLDDIAREFHRQLKEQEEVSFVVKDVKSDAIARVQLQFEIVKHVIKVRVEERDAREKAREKAAKRQQILELIADKQNEELKGKSREELEAILADL